jgi:uncharacterized protein YjbI with pentapeptide repeats
MSILIVPLVFITIFCLGAFFWFWWVAPRAQVPLHLDADQLKQLEVQDRLRQTTYQILTALGLASSFIAAAVQLWITSGQWSADYNLRLLHEQNQQFAEATKNLLAAGDKSYAQQAAQRLAALAAENPEVFGRQAIDTLESVVVDGVKDNHLSDSQTCTIDTGHPEEIKWKNEFREEPPPAAQAAIQQLGQAKLAAMRRTFTGKACADGSKRLTFANIHLDNFDLSWLDLSCSRMSQANLRRVSFRRANLFGADLGGASLADYHIPNSPAYWGMLKEAPFTNQSIEFDETDPPPKEPRSKDVASTVSKIPRWQTYRCFITDLRHADLRGVDFENAALGGADFRAADLTGANFCGSNVSRANFTEAKGLTPEMLKEACVGYKPEDDEGTIKASQPLGLDKKFPLIKKCDAKQKCPQRDSWISNALINRPRR